MSEKYHRLCVEHIKEAIDGNGLRAFEPGDTIRVVRSEQCASDLHRSYKAEVAEEPMEKPERRLRKHGRAGPHERINGEECEGPWADP
ncbi:MAG: hypothetical protein KGJ23_08050 [Euryarchaeota archaeon]|nr:hypothetical protein [Euryarchaeota archaeon]MDE1836553.1 hypothetical protein [Euryarchaeota archaeon]MDE1879252.1 hypothetical protein [Euryarchaeota archaeon]MDE2044523.1 hypothetical protein [Thermoplasmata archaeon]